MWQKQRIFGWKKVFWTPQPKKNKHLTSCDQVASPSPRTWASQKNSQLCWRNVRWFSEDPKNIPGFFETKPCFLSFGNEEKPVDLLGEAYLFWRIPPYVVPSLVAPHSDRRILLPLSSLPWLRKKSELPKLLSNQSASCKSGMCTLPQVGMKMSPRNFVFQLFALNNLFQLEKSSIWPISNPNSEKKKISCKKRARQKKNTHTTAIAPEKGGFLENLFFWDWYVALTNFILQRPPSNQSHCHPPDRGRELNGGNLHGTSTRKHLKVVHHDFKLRIYSLNLKWFKFYHNNF